MGVPAIDQPERWGVPVEAVHQLGERLREYWKRYYEKNKQKVLESIRKRREANPDYARKWREKKWREKNREGLREYKSRWRAKNREKIREYDRKWRAALREQSSDFSGVKLR